MPFTENTIAKLVHHLKYNNLMMVNRANGIPHKFDEIESFSAPILTNEEDWRNLVDEMFSSAERLIQTIANFDETKLKESIYSDFQEAFRNFQGVTEHLYYHFGQIVSIKNYLWKKATKSS